MTNAELKFMEVLPAKIEKLPSTREQAAIAFAAKLMEGSADIKYIVSKAVEIADALMAELKK